MPRHSRTTGLSAIAMVIAAACSGRNLAPGAPLADDSCRFGGASAPRTVTVALGGPVRWENAPVPATAGEELVFRQLFETLFDVDCAGRIVPALAEDWRASSDSSVWVVTLRAAAAFTNGVPVTAPLIAADWSRRGVVGPGEGLVVAGSGRTLELTFDRTTADVPELLSDRRYAVLLSQGGPPLGTTGFAVRPDDPAGLSLAVGPDAPAAPREVRYRYDTGGDPRDLIDQSIDLMVTALPDVVEYAAALGRYHIEPLPWSRTYFLALDAGPPPTAAFDDFAATLARDAIRADARRHQPPPWWHRERCPIVTGNAPLHRAAAIGNLAGDRTGREIAERLVFMAGADGTLPGVLSSLGRDLIAVSFLSLRELQLRTDPGAVAFVGYVNRFERDLCGSLDSLASTERRSVLPLIDTRENMILRNDAPAIVVTGDGIPRFDVRR